MTYQEITHCHRNAKHGKPVHDKKKGTATCPVCGWTGKLRKVKIDKGARKGAWRGYPLPEEIAHRCGRFYEGRIVGRVR